MEWAVPLQKIDVNKINVGQIRYGEKPLAPLAYYDGPIHLPSVNILLPALLVKDYDPQTGRLKLAIQDKSDVLHILSSIQETLLKIVFQKQTEWFPGSRKTSEELHVFFQPFVENSIINLYCPSTCTGIYGPDDSVFNIRFYRFSVAQNHDCVKTAILTAMMLKNRLNVIIIIVKGTKEALLVCM